MPRKYLLWLIGLGSAIVVLLIALIVIVATDDGGEDPAAATTAPTTEAPASTEGTTTVVTAAPTTVPPTTTTTLAPTTTLPPTTTTTTAPLSMGPVCLDVGSRPGSRTDETTATGDFDGDGTQDLIAVYKLGASWFLWARLSGDVGGSYRLVTEINLPWSFQYWDGTTPENLAVMDANSLGGPRDVATVRLYAGLGSYYGLFATQDCELLPFVKEDGTIPSLYSAMGANHSDFPVCDPADRVVRQVVVSCGGSVATCPTLDLVAEEWDVSFDPPRLTVGAAYTRTITQSEYQDLVDDSCIG